MQSYAQTNIQLFNQLRREGYSNTDLSFIRDAYELAMVLFSGRFQPSGKSFIAHVVGTASILASLRLPTPIVAVGLLHNVYLAGDFGDGRHSITTTRREKIRRVLGREAEEYVARFPSLNWKSPTIQRARNNPEKLDSADRNVLLILMADHLEHLLNLDLLYYQDRVRRSYLRNCTLAVETAQSLGLTALAAEVKQGIQETESAELPVEFPVERIAGAAFVIVPKSCRKRLSVTLRQTLIRGLHRVRGLIREILRAFGYQESPRLVKRAFQAQRDRVIRWIRKRKLPKGSLKPNSTEFQNLFPRTASLKRVATGFRFTEGPIWIAEEKRLLFSDIPANRIYGLAADGHVMTVREPSGNSNGLTRDEKGRLIACEHGTRRVTRTEKDGSVTPLADRFHGKKLNSPNDVVVKSDGAIYFTDPAYGITPDQQEQPLEGVYRLATDGKEISLVADDLARPNGLAFSPDEKKLYIDDSERRHIRVYDVRDDGSLSGGSLFHDMNVSTPGAPDGMKVDVEGRVYCTGAGGVWVFDNEGEHLGTIVTPEKPSNCAWGDDDWRSLYVTAVTSVYKIRVNTPGIKVA
jgi:gluconolactonase